MTSCPRCGEQVMIYEYADVLPTALNLYEKCMKCKATFNGRMIERYKETSPFEKEVDENDMPEMWSEQQRSD